MNVSGNENPTADQALERLIEGNRRYVDSIQNHPNQTRVSRLSLVESQHPFAIILGCSDSRVPPEIIFDQGLGDLFVIRLAGNVVDDMGLASIEYAAEHLHAPLLIVLGHSNCGAVQAVIKGGELQGHLPKIAEAIRNAVERARNTPGNLLNNAIRANAKMVAEQLANSKPILVNLVNEKKLKVVAAHYDLSTGLVEILS
jgi:carbonic anhydrase